MTKPVPYKLNDHHFWLSPERCIYWEEKKTLFLSDLHAGKTGHFRKAGIAVPQKVFREDLQRLVSQVLFFKAERVMVLGDLTHSRSNRELELFRRWRMDLHSLHVMLIKGNHDILDDAWYRDSNIEVVEDRWVEDHFCFQHDSDTVVLDEQVLFAFTGHIHPGIHIRGMGKQSLRFPCFYFSDDICVMPAFSQFTGLAAIRPGPQHKVYAIVEKEIIRVK
ncbi:MAG: ligase-associated DNA damage response endonuclease PdeM [Chitinophagaceae bacterium]|nr:ligase-associated DNA damage response endonuclease PdeM [Chitinophagaceae bacterium]